MDRTANLNDALGEPGSPEREEFETAFKREIERLDEMIEANRRSEILTAEDYSIVINCTAD